MPLHLYWPYTVSGLRAVSLARSDLVLASQEFSFSFFVCKYRLLFFSKDQVFMANLTYICLSL